MLFLVSAMHLLFCIYAYILYGRKETLKLGDGVHSGKEKVTFPNSY